MSEFDFARFVSAQDPVVAAVDSELNLGRKTSHWMWFIFPQIAGLGSSVASQRYAIHNLAEAQAYLAHPILGSRLRRHVRLALRHKRKMPEDIFGPIDALKFCSCLTLLLEAAKTDEDRTLFYDALEEFFAGQGDQQTRLLLARA
jgi:uncharacterized protein (DUF1810 family)